MSNKKLNVQLVLYFVCYLLLIFNSSCSLFYVAKQGSYQAKLLMGAKPVSIVLRNPHLDKSIRKKLELISDIKQFSINYLGLKKVDNYSSVNLGWSHEIHAVSASYSLKLKSYTWWFPIIGHVPYKGYFDDSDAIKEENRLKSLGFDTQRRKIGGYSTLGYFSDPVWPNMLKMHDFDLIELIIHELAHATVYIPHQAAFNETFANFVGKNGAIYYVEENFGRDGDVVRSIKKYHKQLEIRTKFFHELYGKLQNIYLSKDSDNKKRAQKKQTLLQAKSDYQKLDIADFLKHIDWSKINNAYLMAFKTYNNHEELFEELLMRENGNWAGFIEKVQLAGLEKDPFTALKQLR